MHSDKKLFASAEEAAAYLIASGRAPRVGAAFPKIRACLQPGPLTFGPDHIEQRYFIEIAPGRWIGADGEVR